MGPAGRHGVPGVGHGDDAATPAGSPRRPGRAGSPSRPGARGRAGSTGRATSRPSICATSSAPRAAWPRTDGELLVGERALACAAARRGWRPCRRRLEDRRDAQLREPRLPAQPSRRPIATARSATACECGWRAAVDAAVDGRGQRGGPGELAPARRHLDGRAAVLDGVEPDVGLVRELLALVAVGGHRGGAQRRRRTGRQRVAQLARRGVRLAGAGAPDEDRELVAAQPPDASRAPRASA